MENEFPEGLKCANLHINETTGTFFCVRYIGNMCDERYCSSYITEEEMHKAKVRCTLRILKLPEDKLNKILVKYYTGSRERLLKSNGITEDEIYNEWRKKDDIV